MGSAESRPADCGYSGCGISFFYMDQITIQPGAAVRGLEAIAMENELLRVVVLPEAGAKVWQIHYKPLAADLLWNNPLLAPARQALYASYDDTWSGGWDELFPNDE